ncbi:MAG: SGNH/GDSL hydrolase family protein [Burkholderiaceae bacterium]|nr:SGNH/GDSL hydrolase family protein [Burkholderiaceae bacterium]
MTATAQRVPSRGVRAVLKKRFGLPAIAAPLLLAQGLYVRRVTPKLPEPPGARAGTKVLADLAQAPQRLRLLIAGDSSAAGVGADHQDEALAGRLVDALAAAGVARRLDWQLIAKSGADVRALLEMLDANEPEPFDVAVLAVGVNDVTGRRKPQDWLLGLDRLVACLRATAPDALLVFSGLPPMHLFPALPRPLRGYLGERARSFDAALRRWTAGRRQTLYVPIPDPGDPELVASDGFHPGPGAYRVWARDLAEAIARHPPG